MARHVVKQLYLPRGKSWDTEIRRLAGQMRDGYPVLIWHEDGLLAFVCADPVRSLMNPQWQQTLQAAVAAINLPSTQPEDDR